ncbi:hypothetical protein Barb7_03025 [Bacteroidales bacterium Barb7]|nr:hypothetical protein Barb7_03025 [Bacteroidales bacterium Barb7]
MFVNPQLQAGILKRYIANQDTEPDGNKEHRFKFVPDGEVDEEQTYRYHDQVTGRCIINSCVGQEQLKVLAEE